MGSVGTDVKDIPTSCLDPKWTDMIIASMGPNVSPRLREIFASLIRHIHEFTKETNLTIDEWQAGMKFVNETGQASSGAINELQILLDVFGQET